MRRKAAICLLFFFRLRHKKIFRSYEVMEERLTKGKQTFIIKIDSILINNVMTARRKYGTCSFNGARCWRRDADWCADGLCF